MMFILLRLSFPFRSLMDLLAHKKKGRELTKYDGGGSRDILWWTQRLSRHDRNLKAEANAEAGKGLIADPDGTRRCRVESVDHAAAHGREDGSEDDKGGEVAQFGDEDAGGPDGYGLKGS